MKNKTVISIDLWGTLIKASPLFGLEKIALIERELGNSKEDILIAFKKTKSSVDYIIERTGWQPTRDNLWKLLLSNLSDGHKYLINDSTNLIDKLRIFYVDLAVKHIPNIYSEETIYILQNMHSHYQLVLSSNTLFLGGYILEKYLIELDIYKYFSKLNFSDQLGVSKPNKLMYGDSQYHIGDNLRTDYYGAIANNSIPYLVNSNDKTLLDAYKFIQEKENGIGKICGS